MTHLIPSFLSSNGGTPSFLKKENRVATVGTYPVPQVPSQIATSDPYVYHHPANTEAHAHQSSMCVALPKAAKPLTNNGIVNPPLKPVARPSFLPPKVEAASEQIDVATSRSSGSGEVAMESSTDEAKKCNETKTLIAPTNKVCLIGADDPSPPDQPATAQSEERHILAERFKTKMCRNFLTQGFCPYESRCMFAHGDAEMRTAEMNIRDGLFTEEAIKAFKRGELPQPAPTVVVGVDASVHARAPYAPHLVGPHGGNLLTSPSFVMIPQQHPVPAPFTQPPYVSGHLQGGNATPNWLHYQPASYPSLPKAAYEAAISSNPFVNNNVMPTAALGPNTGSAPYQPPIVQRNFGGGHFQLAQSGRSVEEAGLGYQSVQHSLRPYTPTDQLVETEEEIAGSTSLSPLVRTGGSERGFSAYGSGRGAIGSGDGGVAALQTLISSSHVLRGEHSNKEKINYSSAKANASSSPDVGVVGDGSGLPSSREGSGRAVYTFGSYGYGATDGPQEGHTAEARDGPLVSNAFLQSLNQLQQMSDYYHEQNTQNFGGGNSKEKGLIGNGVDSSPEDAKVQQSRAHRHYPSDSINRAMYNSSSTRPLLSSNVAMYDSGSQLGSARPEGVVAPVTINVQNLSPSSHHNGFHPLDIAATLNAKVGWKVTS